MKICKVCGIEKPLSEFYSNGWTSKTREKKKFKPSCKSCEQEHDSRRYYKIITEHFGSMSCMRCGYNKCVAALDLHHINPDEKEYGVAKMRNYSKDKIVAELSKCLLLCANCHREEHYMGH